MRVRLEREAALEVVERFKFGPDELAELEPIGVDGDVRNELGALEMSGEVWSVEEGTVVLAQEPILEVTAPMPIAQLLETAIVIASGGMDEYAIHELIQGGAPIDRFGVGTALAVSEDHPGSDIVYKPVEYAGRSVAKFSGARSTFPGPKQVFHPPEGIAGDVLDRRDAEGSGTPLLAPVWRDGERLGDAFDRDAIRARVDEQLAALPETWRTPPYLEGPPLPTVGVALDELTEHVCRTAPKGGLIRSAGTRQLRSACL